MLELAGLTEANEPKIRYGVELDFALDTLRADIVKLKQDDIRDWGDANGKKALAMMKQIDALDKKIRKM